MPIQINKEKSLFWYSLLDWIITNVRKTSHISKWFINEYVEEHYSIQLEQIPSGDAGNQLDDPVFAGGQPE